MPAEYMCVCMYFSIYTQRVNVFMYIVTYIHTEFTCVLVCIYVHVHRVFKCIRIYLRIGTQRLPGWVCVYICEYKHRVYMCMCIFTYMSPRLDVGVYIGRVVTQSLHVGVSVVAYIHTGFTCGCKCLYVFTYIHTEFTHVCCVYMNAYTLGVYKCMCVYLRVCTQSSHVCVYAFTYMDIKVVCGYIQVHIYT